MRRDSKYSNDAAAQETGAIKKKWTGKLPVALVFPSVYRVGMSNLGFQLVYDLVNSVPEIVCERFFYPDDQQVPTSIESGRLLRDFPIVLFSVSFEQDYFNLLQILRSSGIEPLAVVRKNRKFVAGEPLIIGGGVATFINPEPLAPVMDLFLIGEAEPVLPGLLNALLEKIYSIDKETLLFEMAATISGCYAPRFYSFNYNEDGTVASVSAREGLPTRIKKNILAKQERAGHSKILTPAAEFSNIYLTELGRGCSRGCRFCAAGFVYRPPRLWNADAVIKAFKERPAASKRIGLLGMEMARKDDLSAIVEYLLENSCELSFSSLRADIIDATLLKLLSSSRIKSVAIAPDGGSQRLRRVINKGITEQDILRAVELLAEAGIRKLKLYFMIGLPTETPEDLEEMVELTRKIKKVLLGVGRSRGRLSEMTLSVNSFVPKPWTPFQYHPFEQVSVLKEKIKFLRKRLGGEPNIRLLTDQPGKILLQAVLSRGDRRVGLALSQLKALGGWAREFIKTGADPEVYAGRHRGKDEFFPWEIIDHGIDRKYLWAEYQRALKEKTTPKCDTMKCKRCGVCL